MQRMAPDYDSDYYSTGSLPSNSSSGSEISDNSSYSRVIIDNRSHYEETHVRRWNYEREKRQVAYFEDCRVEPESRTTYHQYKHNNRLAPPAKQYQHPSRLAFQVSQGHPETDSRQFYRRPVHVPESQFERLVVKDRQQKDNVYKQIKDREAPLKTSSGNTYYVRLQFQPPV